MNKESRWVAMIWAALLLMLLLRGLIEWTEWVYWKGYERAMDDLGYEEAQKPFE